MSRSLGQTTRGHAGVYCDRLRQRHDLLRAARPRASIGRKPVSYKAERSSLISGCKRFRTLAPLCGVRFRPKHHLYVHLVFRTDFMGNPRFWGATWEDESWNSQLAAVAKGAHPLTWSRRLLSTFKHELGPAAQGLKRSKKR